MNTQSKPISRWLVAAALAAACSLAAIEAAWAVVLGGYPTLPAQFSSNAQTRVAADSESGAWFPDISNKSASRIALDGTVTTHPIPGFGMLTGGIGVAADGTVWLTKEFPGNLVRLVPGVGVTEYSGGEGVEVTQSPIIGPDGNVWFIGNGSAIRSNIVRFIGEGRTIRYKPLAAEAFVVGLSRGPDNHVWYVTTGQDATKYRVGRVSVSGQIEEHALPAGPSGGMAWSADGILWVALDGSLAKVTQAGVVTPIPLPAGWSSWGIAVGLDGYVYFTDAAESRIGRLAQDGSGFRQFPTTGFASHPHHMARAPNGLIWYAESTNMIGLIGTDEPSAFFPLVSGSTASYDLNGVPGFTRTVSPGTFDINGTPTKQVTYSDGETIYYTNDALGIREHAEVVPGLTVTLVPPVLLLAPEPQLGTPALSSGTAFLVGPGVPPSMPYSASSVIEKLERVTVPAGTFMTAKMSTTVTLGGIASVQQRAWMAKDLPPIRGEMEGLGQVFALWTSSLARTTPDPFEFMPVFGAAAATAIVSHPAMVTSITQPVAIAVAGGEYSLDGGPFTATAGTVSSGREVRVRVTSSAAPMGTSTATLTVGPMSVPFRVTTAPAYDTVPEAFAFPPAPRVWPTTGATSSEITVDGIDAPSPISVSEGCFTVSAGPCTTEPGYVGPGDKVTISANAAATRGTAKDVVLTIGGVSGTFTVVSTPLTHQSFYSGAWSKIVWRNAVTGENIIWAVDEGNILDRYVLLRVADTAWRIVGTSDFDGDEVTDIVWRHGVTGQNVIWLMEWGGTARKGYANLPGVQDSAWKVAAVADFDGDGRPDPLWRHDSTGQNVLWKMNGVALQSVHYLSTVPDGNWRVAGSADFDGDGRADILWRHAGSGQNILWRMSGPTRLAAHTLSTVPDTQWKVASVADFNGDGKADILWRHAVSGQNVMWLMNGGVRTAVGALSTVVSAWAIVATGDYNGDGKADILWRNEATGQNVEWLMNGTVRSAARFLSTVPDANWKVVP